MQSIVTLTRRHAHWAGADVPMVSYAGAGLSQRAFLHADHQGSIVASTNASGAATVNSYDQYGIPAPANAGRFQYTGQIWLSELGMYYYKARVYSPTLGRFMQTDPIGYEDQINPYAYSINDPLNRVDPRGDASYFAARGVAARPLFSIGGITVELSPGRNDLAQFGHGFLSVGGGFVGDPATQIISFGDRGGILDNISDLRSNLASGQSTNEFDRRAWLAMRGSDRNVERIDAPDSVVARVAGAVQPREYSVMGPNSTSAAAAVAIRAEGIAGQGRAAGLSLRNFDYWLPGSGGDSTSKIQFNRQTQNSDRPCSAGGKNCF